MDRSDRLPQLRLPLFWLFQTGGWMLFWGTMVTAGLSQWPIGYTLANKTLLTVPGFVVSLLLYSIFRLALHRGVALPILVAVSFPLAWAAAAAWMAAYNLLLVLYLAGHNGLTATAWRRFPDFNNAIYYAFVLLAWSLLYFGVKTYLAHERDRARLQVAETLAQSARLRALRLQLDPHFLFNSLNSISTLIAEGRNAEANRMLSQLGDFFRMTLDAPESSEVPLQTEIDLALRYLDVERNRFGDRLRVAIDVDPDAEAALVPVLILQPLVENAVRHAVQMQPEGGTIIIAAMREDRWLVLRVDDDGPGLGKEVPERSGIGIANTRDRLEQLYGAEGEMRFSRSASGGVSVSLRFPFHDARVEE